MQLTAVDRRECDIEAQLFCNCRIVLIGCNVSDCLCRASKCIVSCLQLKCLAHWIERGHESEVRQLFCQCDRAAYCLRPNRIDYLLHFNVITDQDLLGWDRGLFRYSTCGAGNQIELDVEAKLFLDRIIVLVGCNVSDCCCRAIKKTVICLQRIRSARLIKTDHKTVPRPLFVNYDRATVSKSSRRNDDQFRWVYIIDPDLLVWDRGLFRYSSCSAWKQIKLNVKAQLL